MQSLRRDLGKVTLSEASVQRLVDRHGRNGATQAIWPMSWFNMLARFVSSTRVPVENHEVLAVLGQVGSIAGQATS